jgi:hypothetical protein
VKVLVTGASGFIGSALCDALLVRGDTVVGLTRDSKQARSTNPNVLWQAWEPTLERPAAEAFEGVEAVVNLLGEKINQRWTDEAKERIMESRRTATHNLVGTIAALERKPKVLVSQSAIGFYGDRGEAIMDESASSGEGFDAEVVREWEAAAGEVEATGVRLAIVRTGHVLDPGGGLLRQMLTPFKLGVGGPLAGGDQYMSWIHVDDEVGILLWAIDNDTVTGVINSTAPEPVTNRELSKALGRALHRPASMPVPGFVPRRALDLGYEFRFIEIDQALADLI